MTDNQEPRSVIFARKVRQLREDRDWSQAELGQHVGLGQSRVAAIEATGSVTIDQAQTFADALGVPIEFLLYAEPPATLAVQFRRLLQLAGSVQQLGDDVHELVNTTAGELNQAVPVAFPVRADARRAAPIRE